MKIESQSRKWWISCSAPFKCKLSGEGRGYRGWCHVTLVAQNDAARQFIKDYGRVYLHQNRNPISVELLKESDSRLGVLFYRHHTLERLTLRWVQLSEHGEVPRFAFKMRSVSRLTAWVHMLREVSRRDKAVGHSPRRIYWMSRARYKRAGYSEALRKLVEEYRPFLSHQLISCEPYQHWQDTFEFITSPDDTVTDPFVIYLRPGLAGADFGLLKETLYSLRDQQHQHWQALFKLPSGSVPGAEIETLIRQDKRIRLLDESEPDFASWVMVMDYGDTLVPHALQTLAVEGGQGGQVLYCDHDLINDRNQRAAPKFKPKWNPEFIRRFNFVGPSFCMHKTLAASLPAKFWELPHYALLLQAASKIDKNKRGLQIRRVSQVLYHRLGKNKAKQYSVTSKELVVQSLRELLDLDGDTGAIISEGDVGTAFRVQYILPTPPPLISILVPTRDALGITRNCINSILNGSTYPNYEIIILDNQSEQADTLEWFAEIGRDPRVRIERYDAPFNYSAINNFGVSKARGELVCLLNNDTEVINPGWLEQLSSLACRPQAGAVGAKLYYFDDTVQHAGVIMGLFGLAGHSHKHYHRSDHGYQNRLLCVQNLSAVTAACLMVSKHKYEEVGGLNENDLTVAFNDVDFCLKLDAAGYENVWTPHAELYHYESKTRGKDDTPEKRAREQREIEYMQNRWHHVIAQDPAYSPNLTRKREDFSIKM